MFAIHSPQRMFVALAMLLLAGAAHAQSNGAGDLQEINRYRLTDAALAKYVQAVRNLEAAPGAAAARCSEDDDENGTTIDAAVAKINAAPGAAAAVKAAGLSPREYVVFGMSAMQAGLAAWALTQPGGKLPAGVSMDNVNFYRAHEAALKKLGTGDDASSACDAADAE